MTIPDTGARRLAMGVAMYFGVKCYRLSKSIGHLLDVYQASEARIQLRVLCEHYIVFNFIMQDPNDRAPAFVDFTPVHQTIWIDRLRKHDEVLDLGEDFFANAESQIREDYDRLVDDYRTRRGKVRATWTGQDLARQAEVVAEQTGEQGLVELYDLLYRPMSEAVHPSPSDLRFYLGTGEGGQIEPLFDDDVAEAEAANIWAAILTLKLAALIEDGFGLGLSKEIGEVDRAMSQLLEERKQGTGVAASPGAGAA